MGIDVTPEAQDNVAAANEPAGERDYGQWAQVAARLSALWREFLNELAPLAARDPQPWFRHLSQVLALAQGWLKDLPLAQLRPPPGFLDEAQALWASLAQAAASDAPPLPGDPRFADPLWRDEPFATMHETWLLFCKQLSAAASQVESNNPASLARLQFVLRLLTGALSPANFPLTNPRVVARARETKGESLVMGFEHLLADLRRGQLTHSDPAAFRPGENIAATPGKVVHETPLYQLLQYTPATSRVLAPPLVIFPPWINRCYVLDLEPAKSFVRWAVEQGISTFMVSWKSADESMADVAWDDYIAAQIDAIDHVRARLSAPSVHTIGYCVAGTTLAATLAILARRGEADKVRSATFLAAQVDFSEGGDLKLFVDDAVIETIGRLSPKGYLDGRYMAAVFNLLRSGDLIWPYVERHYLLGEDYRAFDMLHWNGDVANLPAGWLTAYLRDLYRDNRLVEANALTALGVPIDLSLIETPCYVQAGREDHIAPAQSVWKATRHMSGPVAFVLAGSGHIASVVNPPASGKYGYWTGPETAHGFAEFIVGAHQFPGSWWPHWLDWLRAHDCAQVPARGRRKPGGKGDKPIEDAPGRYVATR